MKTRIFSLLMTFAILGLWSCDKEDVTPASVPAEPGNLATVQFEMKAAAFNTPRSRVSFQKYEPVHFRILAFRHDGTDYTYTDDVDFTAVNWSGDRFIGNAQLPVGKYQFVSAYGVPTATTSFVELSTPAQPDENLTATHISNGVLPAIFLGEDAELTSYDLGMVSGENTKVTASLKRAVSRLDILFVRGDTVGGNNTERPATDEDGDILGVGIAEFKIDFDKVSPTVRMTDGGLKTADPIAHTYYVGVDTTLITGTNETATIVGAPGYNFEGILEEDIVKGAAYFYGPFIFPNPEATPDITTLTLNLTSKPDAANNNHVYTRKITVKNLTLKRNKVTLVKVYVTGKDIFHTGNHFDVEVKDAWDGVEEIPGVIS